MALLDQILEENARFVAQLPESYLHRNEKVSKYPARQLAIYTCMDKGKQISCQAAGDLHLYGYAAGRFFRACHGHCARRSQSYQGGGQHDYRPV